MFTFIDRRYRKTSVPEFNILIYMETKLPNSVSLAFVEALYVDYLRDPESVSPDWRQIPA